LNMKMWRPQHRGSQGGRPEMEATYSRILAEFVKERNRR